VTYDGHAIWTAVSEDGRVLRIDARSMRVTDRVRVGRGPVNVLFSHGAVFVTNNDERTIMRIDPRSRRVIGSTIRVANDLRGAAATRDAWFVGTDPSGVVRLSE
jgi:DNA-binding beta-propeller fold protein YncE